MADIILVLATVSVSVIMLAAVGITARRAWGSRLTKLELPLDNTKSASEVNLKGVLENRELPL